MTRCLFNLMAACLMLAGLPSLLGCNGARDTAIQMGETSNHRGFVRKTIQNEGRSRQYAIFLPLNYTPDRKWPAIMFLHGVGEAGSDLNGPMRVGLAPFVADRASSFPFIVIIPQSTGGWDPKSDGAKDAIAALLQAQREYAIDPDRVALTGLSTGGYGTFAIGAKYNHLFAALVPMCPSGADGSDGAILSKMNIWAFENAMDPFVSPFSMAASLGSISGAGGTFKHTVYANFGHDCWDRAYGEGELFDWLQQQRRSTAAAPGAPVQATEKTPAPPQPTASALPVSTPHHATSTVIPVAVPVASPVSNSRTPVPPTPY